MPCRSRGEGTRASRASHKLEGVIAAVTDVSFVEEADSPTGAHDKFPLFGLSRERHGKMMPVIRNLPVLKINPHNTPPRLNFFY